MSLLLLASCSPSAPPKPKAPRDAAIAVRVAKVRVEPQDRSLPVVGTLLAIGEATIAAQVEGQVERTSADFGARVQKGQELARIDTETYESLARQSAANLAKARANALNAEQSLKRVIELQKNSIASASEMDLATAQAEQARAEVRAVEAAEAIAQLNLRRSRAVAPFDGAVAERIAHVGDYVKIGTPLFELVDDTDLKFVMQAPEKYAGQVKTGQAVHFSVDALPGREFEGQVYLISPEVNLATRSFNVGARVPNRGGELKANTFARGDLLLEEAVPTPLVPLEAVVSFAGVTKVFVIEDNTARMRNVKLGRVRGDFQEVLEGLREGEAVATMGQTKLYEGAKVRVQTPEPTAPTTATSGAVPQS